MMAWQDQQARRVLPQVDARLAASEAEVKKITGSDYDRAKDFLIQARRRELLASGHAPALVEKQMRIDRVRLIGGAIQAGLDPASRVLAEAERYGFRTNKTRWKLPDHAIGVAMDALAAQAPSEARSRLIQETVSHFRTMR